ncbi:hypothetical protein [Demequina sp.]|uniref:hypothetical protein n=1 Tax=Demequina sp. TaxID=2050685 RepID=UPI003A8A2484
MSAVETMPPSRGRTRQLGLRVLSGAGMVLGAWAGAVAFIAVFAVGLKGPLGLALAVALVVVIAAGGAALTVVGRVARRGGAVDPADPMSAVTDPSWLSYDAREGAVALADELLRGAVTDAEVGTRAATRAYSRATTGYGTVLAEVHATSHDRAGGAGGAGDRTIVARAANEYRVVGQSHIEARRIEPHTGTFTLYGRPPAAATLPATVPVAVPGLIDPWTVAEHEHESAIAALDGRAISVLNDHYAPGLVVSVVEAGIVVSSDGAGAPPHPEHVGDAAQALYDALAGQPPAGSRAARRREELIGGVLVSGSAGRDLQRRFRMLLGVSSSVLLVIVGASYLPGMGSSGAQPGPLDGWFAPTLGAALVVMAVLASRLMPAWQRRQEGIALQIREIADARGWAYRTHDRELGEGWVATLFAGVHGVDAVVVSPSSRGAGGLAPMGVAYVEGDRGRWPWLRPLTSVIAWAELPGGQVPSVALTRLAAEASDLGLSLHIDEHRAVLRDDGRPTDISMAERLRLVGQAAWEGGARAAGPDGAR